MLGTDAVLGVRLDLSGKLASSKRPAHETPVKTFIAAGVMAMLFTASTFAVETPSRSERLKQTVDGVSVEYSPGLEAYVAPVVERSKPLRARAEEQLHRLNDSTSAPLPLSPKDLRANRDAVLALIAQQIGLEKPTELQERCFDTMLEHYELQAGLRYAMARAALVQVQHQDFAIWRRGDLISRLEAGEQIDGMSYDPQTKQGSFEFKFNFNLAQTEEMKARIEAAKSQRLTQALNYTIDKDGVAHIKASFALDLRKGAVAEQRYTTFDPYVDFNQRVDAQLKTVKPFTSPIIVPDDSSPDDIENVISKNIGMLEATEDMSHGTTDYRDGALVMVVLHETTELGIIEQYIGSADRRWFCDGVANYVAWKIANERAGVEFAKSVYDLDGQLRRLKPNQSKVNLRKWAAVEREEAKATSNQELIEAHYAFATRTVQMMVERNGEDFLPKLFRELGKTPRQKTSYKTVQKAYQSLTKQKLENLIETAEKAPVT